MRPGKLQPEQMRRIGILTLHVRGDADVKAELLKPAVAAEVCVLVTYDPDSVGRWLCTRRRGRGAICRCGSRQRCRPGQR